MFGHVSMLFYNVFEYGSSKPLFNLELCFIVSPLNQLHCKSVKSLFMQQSCALPIKEYWQIFQCGEMASSPLSLPRWAADLSVGGCHSLLSSKPTTSFHRSGNARFTLCIHDAHVLTWAECIHVWLCNAPFNKITRHWPCARGHLWRKSRFWDHTTHRLKKTLIRI